MWQMPKRQSPTLHQYFFFRKTKRKLLLKNTVKTSMNDEYTHSTQSPLEGPKYIKKYVQNQNKKMAEHLINKYNK